MVSRFIIAASLAAALLPAAVFGQTYGVGPHLMITAGSSTQLGGLSPYWDTGAQGKLTIRIPVGGSMAFGLQGGVVGPMSKDDNSELMQVPLRGLLYFPLAPEASGTPYLAVGAGATIDIFGCQRVAMPCYLDCLPDSTDDTQVHFAYTLILGYTMRPEAFARAFFDFAVRYDQQVIDNVADYTNLDVEVSVGLNF
jgi:hypothetical protein